jgi:hypothetical protein
MKRILSVFLSLLLWFSIVPLSNYYPTIVLAAKEGNRPASFMALRLLKVGYDRDGKEIDPGVQVDPNNPDSGPRYFPWEFRRGSSWGRKEVVMMTKPLYWFEFYLTVKADAGESKPEHRWVGVIDTHGKLWLDPDGHFHDSSYDRLADPKDPAYIAGACENNPRAQRDPASNTQGPYILDPTDPSYKKEIYFFDKLVTGRGFRIGWVDMVDYPAADTLLPDGQYAQGIVNEGDWDIGANLEQFINNGDEDADWNEEWHTDHIHENEYYDVGEGIYRLADRSTQTPGPERNSIQVGDFRLAHISMTDGLDVYTYHPASFVVAGDKDIGMKLIPFKDDGGPVIDPGEEWHTIRGQGNDTFDPGENIYLKLNGLPEPFVQVGDMRRTNVNTRNDKHAIAGGIFAGDVMIFSEVLSADCDGTNRYDLTVQSDIWLGSSPSVATARLFSPNDDVPAQTQRIQKSTLLDPDGLTFTIPATTFHDVSVKYRSYIGVQIFADNGLDVNLGANLVSDTLFAQNGSDDYRTGRTGEEFLGAVNGNYSFDYNRMLTTFQGNEFFFDLKEDYTDPLKPNLEVNDPDCSYYKENDFGCNTPIYRKISLPPDYQLEVIQLMGIDFFIKYVLEPGDIRLTPVTMERNGQRASYPANSVVTAGDLDLDPNYWLKPMPATIQYYNMTDETTDNIEYNEGDPIYRSNDSVVNTGDIRLSELEYGRIKYLCNTDVGEYDFWLRETPVHMLSMGLNGDGRCFDMTVVPGKLDIDIQIDKPFKVEQTAQINAKVNTPLEKDQKVYLAIKEPVVPSFGGLRPEAFYSPPIMVPHEFLPIVPEGQDPKDYLIAPYPYDPRIRDVFGNTWGVFNVLTQHLPWSNPRAYGRDSMWRTRTTTNISSNSFSTYYNTSVQSDDNPASAPRRGPYPWGIPTPTSGRKFQFPFDGTKYEQLWIAPFPALSLFNGAPNKPWYVDNDPTMNSVYQIYNVMTTTYTSFPPYGNTPAMVAYGEWYYYNYYLYYMNYYQQLYGEWYKWYYGSWVDMFERSFMTISPARFEKATGHGESVPGYFPNSQVVNSTNFGYNYDWDARYYHADHFGRYNHENQMPGNGVYGYLDETSTPRRVIITWRVNHGYDYRYQAYYYYTNTRQTAYQPYNVQIVLYEDGTFQYNYDGGNQWWGIYEQYPQYLMSNVPVVGWYGGRRTLRQLATIPGVYNWHNNKNLQNAPSVRWTYTELAGIDKTDEKRLFVDYRELDHENQEVTFQYTPYRGTCNEDGTRTRLEITAYLDRGGYTNPVPLTPLADVFYDLVEPSVGTIESEIGYNIYVDVDSNRLTSPGDIRLTRCIQAGQQFALGTVVQAGDTDNDLIFTQYDVPLGGAIYDGSSNREELGKLLVYADMNRNGIADEGDVRLVPFANYEHGSLIGTQDWENYFNYQIRETVLFPARAPIGVMKDRNGVLRNVYWDRDASQTLTPYDVRLTPIESYEHGTRVMSGDADMNTFFTLLDARLGVVDPMNGTEPSEAYPSAIENASTGCKANIYANMGDMPIVKAGDIRLSDAYVMNGTEITGKYNKGTMVRAGDLDEGTQYTYDNPPVLVWNSEWGNGVYLDMDNDGLPTTGDIRLVKNKWTARGRQQFQYYGYYYDWQPGTDLIWYNFPYYYLLEEFDPGTILVYNQTYVYDYTPGAPPPKPYRRPWGTTVDNYHRYPYTLNPPWMTNPGTVERDLAPTISVTATNKVYLNRGSAHTSVAVGDIRLTEIGILHQGTHVVIDSPDRQSHFMFDPYWAKHPWTKLELDANPYKAVRPTPQAGPDPLIPFHIYDGYDCYAWEKYDIAPEEYIIETERDCLNLNEQRFPNLTIRMIDADNPNDVNDPANVIVSGDPQERLIMNFNAHGGGIKFFFTAIGEPPSYQKYIGQYNEDDTVVFWYWYDNHPYGVLDPNDFLMTNPDHLKSSPFKPVGGDPLNPYSSQAPPFPARIWDIDCSFGQTVCTIPGDKPGFPKLGEVNNRNYEFAYKTGDIEGLSIWNHGDWIINQNATAPSFDGRTQDPQVLYWRMRGDRSQTNYISPPRAYGTVFTYGIPVQVTNYTDEDEGGRAVVPIKPFKTDTPVTIRMYSSRVIYDYNSRYPHGPAFINDMAPGVDYVGIKDIKVLEPDPRVNFGEFNIVDHGLQNSKVNYTTGGSPLSPLDYPSPLISADYEPLLKDLKRDMRVYPGGQTHTGRVANAQMYSGFNSTPAIWKNMFNKLGSEMMPFTDYGFYFILHDGMDRRIFWDPNAQTIDQNIKSITVQGPFMMPKVHERLGGTGALTRALKTNYPQNLPVQYDFSGKLVIDTTNYTLFSSTAPPDFTDLASPNSVDAFRYSSKNQRLVESKKLWYYGADPTPSPISQQMSSHEAPNLYHTVNWIDEIIPIGHGKISIVVELFDGTIKKYEDCCQDIYDDIPVNGLELSSNVETIEVDTPTRLEVQLKEYDTKSYPADQHVIPCNDALVLLWQDRGIKDVQGKLIGSGDGWITVPPRSSDATGFSTQISHFYDLNKDGKISYQDWETEIIGTYDLASNTWKSGVIDARTLQRNNGAYHFDLSPSNGALVDTVGIDFGGPVTRNNQPDNVIDDYELLPIYVTAYKFGDDNNDKAFTPLYSLSKPYEFSHEVYMAGLKHLPVTPKNDLIVSYGPDPLTAGCVPELLENEQPLTFTVLDAEGSPVDLRKGLTNAYGSNVVDEKVIWNVLFKDPHPDNKTFFGPKAILPQYYWIRTDLQNDDGSMVNNFRQFSFSRFPFQPIEIDFNRASEGIYAFKGFCANDEGSFKVFVDTPDRRRRGVVDVKVQLPDVFYAIRDYDLNRGGFYQDNSWSFSPGQETDFVMTAANYSGYLVIAVIKDAQGNPIRGVKSELCEGGESLTRFTPYTTKPDNFDYFPVLLTNMTNHSTFGYYTFGFNRPAMYISSLGARYYNNVVMPSKVDPNVSIIYTFGFQPIYLKPGWTNPFAQFGGATYYNTSNWQWENGEWELYPVLDLPPANNLRGFGRGAIYNSAHKGGYLFANREGQPYIDHEDSMQISEEGQAYVLMGANDIGEYGGLIGKNPYSNSIFGDVAGNLWNFRGRSINPGDIRYRYNQYLSDTAGFTNADGTYRLDWDAFPSHDARIARPVAKVYDASRNVLLETELIDPRNYDLVYGKANHLKVELSPAASPNLGIRPGGTLILSDDSYFPDDTAFEGKSENMVWGSTATEEFGVNTSVSTTLMLTPTGSWKNLAQLKYFGFYNNWQGNMYIRDNRGLVWDLAKFDIIRSLEIQVKTNKQPIAGESSQLIVYATELGTKKPVSDASVRINGAGVDMTARTDREGVARFDIMPKSKGIIAINVDHKDLGEGYNEVHVMEPPEPNEILLEVQASKTLTNENTVTITGKTNPGNILSINEKAVTIKTDGSFEAKVELQEGSNQIVVSSTDRLGRTARKILTVVRRSHGPSLFVDEVPQLVDVREYELKGKVSPGATVKAGGKLASVQGEDWKVQISLDFGKNNVKIEAIDEIGNTSSKEIEIMVYHKVEIRLGIGSKRLVVNGVPADKELDVAPYVKNAKTFVPLRVLSESLGAKVQWLPDVKGIVIELMGKKIEMQIGSGKAIINGKVADLDSPPEITQGVTFVPLRFVADVLGAETQWIAESREIVVTLLSY